MRQMLLVSTAMLSWACLVKAETPVPETVAPGAKLTEVYVDETIFFEGPTWDPKGQKLYFTAFHPQQKNQQILKLGPDKTASVWLNQSQGINGTYLLNNGNLVGAQAYGHRVMQYDFGPNGPETHLTVIGSDLWNQPNDICQTPNGDLYFTDPDFNNRQTSAVFRFSAGGELTKIISDMPVPNGLITSRNGKTLYVGDSHLLLWRSYPIDSEGKVGPGQTFFDPDTENRDSPDGMSIDERGNLYFSGRGGVWVVNPSGKSLGLIAIPEFCSNVTFGGTHGRTLYLTCSGKLYSLKMAVRGGQFPHTESP